MYSKSIVKFEFHVRAQLHPLLLRSASCSVVCYNVLLHFYPDFAKRAIFIVSSLPYLQTHVYHQVCLMLSQVPSDRKEYKHAANVY